MITTDTTNKLGTTVPKDLRAVSARWMEADAETLWAEIRELARNQDHSFAARILEVGEHEHWTVTHVALALAHMVLANNRFSSRAPSSQIEVCSGNSETVLADRVTAEVRLRASTGLLVRNFCRRQDREKRRVDNT